MSAMASTSSSLKEYLKKYTTNGDEEKKKKKKKKRVKPEAAGVLVVDEDPIWQKPVKLEEEEEDSADEEKPQVDEDIEVKRMRRLELLRSKRPYGAISEDGSGWVSVSDISENVKTEVQSSDISPPRSRRHRNDTPSPRTEHQCGVPADTDLSPPRQRRKEYLGPPSDTKLQGGHKARYVTPPDPHLEASQSERIVADLSPPRRHKRQTPELEPERKSAHSRSIDSDISPPRRPHRGPKRQNDYQTPFASDLSPPRKVRNEDFVLSARNSGPIDSDISPPRRPRHNSKHQNDSRGPSISDLSPPRNVRNDSISVLPVKKSTRDWDERDASVSAPSVSDLSPPRKRKGSPLLVHRPKTGLVSGVDIKEEIDKKKKEDLLRFKEMDPSVSGRNAEPIYRNKVTGERMSKEEFLELQKKDRKKEDKPKEINIEWGKGLAQKREAEKRLEEMEAEKNKPFARSRDDPDLDRMLKDRLRWGDPMAHLVKRKHLEPVLPDLGVDEKMKESGFIIPQEIPSHSWIRRRLDAAPNRYGIKPGRHWDSVDRSNGYEKQLFKRTNEKSATEREAYLWSVSDM